MNTAGVRAARRRVMRCKSTPARVDARRRGKHHGAPRRGDTTDCRSSASSTCSAAAPCMRVPARAIGTRRCRTRRAGRSIPATRGHWRRSTPTSSGSRRSTPPTSMRSSTQQPQDEVTKESRARCPRHSGSMPACDRLTMHGGRSTLGASRVIVGLETLPSFEVLSAHLRGGRERTRRLQPRPARRPADRHQRSAASDGARSPEEIAETGGDFRSRAR